jgi:hypothetical protein
MGDGGRDELITLSLDDDSGRRQQASSSEKEGYPNGSETDASATTAAHELETGPILVGEVLPPEDAPSFERFWNACADPQGPLGFALSEWNKLCPDEQRRACERPSLNGTYAGTWLRERAFDLPLSVVERRPCYNGFAAMVYENILESGELDDAAS